MLRDKLSNQNVILMHRTLESSDYDDPLLLQYYTQWLPEQVAAAQPVYCLKCIQPVRWDAARGFRTLARRLASLLGRRNWFCTDQERDALVFMDNVKASRRRDSNSRCR